MKPHDLKREGVRTVHLSDPEFGSGGSTVRTSLLAVTVCFSDQDGNEIRSERLDFSDLSPPRTWDFMQSHVNGINRGLDDLFGD